MQYQAGTCLKRQRGLSMEHLIPPQAPSAATFTYLKSHSRLTDHSGTTNGVRGSYKLYALSSRLQMCHFSLRIYIVYMQLGFPTRWLFCLLWQRAKLVCIRTVTTTLVREEVEPKNKHHVLVDTEPIVFKCVKLVLQIE